MEFDKLSLDEVKAFDVKKLRETEDGIRKSMMEKRLDIFSERGKHDSSLQKLKRRLAWIMTVSTEKKLLNNKVS